jgi:adenosylhomocysteine nucleosidase
MPHRDIAIVVAMSREVAPLLAGIRARQSDGVEFYELQNAVIAVGGIGRDAAGRAAEAVVEQYSPRVLVSAGIAGALKPDLKVGDVIRASEVVGADSGVRHLMSGGEVTVVTASSVNGSAEKRALARRWGAAVVDMESSAVAAVAQRHGVQFAAMKAVSDALDFEMPPVGRFVNDTGKFDTLAFAMFLVIRPKWWSAVKHLNANSRIAAVNLSLELQHLIHDGFKVINEENVLGA